MSGKPPKLLGNWNDLREPRRGILLHYDSSANDKGAIAWLRDDPRAKVSYNWLILDNGAQVTIAPETKRAWHAGVCRPSDPRLAYKDANSALYGVCVAAGAGDTVTVKQFDAVVALCAALCTHHGWGPDEVWRIVGHETEAWPRGRKVDPTGPDPARPVLAVGRVRDRVAAVLRGEWPATGGTE